MLAKLLQWILQPILIRFLEKMAIVIPNTILEYLEKQKKEKAAKEAKDKFDSVVNDPKSSKEEVADAFKNYINSGNKP